MGVLEVRERPQKKKCEVVMCRPRVGRARS